MPISISAPAVSGKKIRVNGKSLEFNEIKTQLKVI